MANKNKILIHVEGGVVQDVFASDPSGVEIIIRDSDIDGCVNSLYEDNNRNLYQEYNEGAQPWSNLETQPFETPVG